MTVPALKHAHTRTLEVNLKLGGEFIAEDLWFVFTQDLTDSCNHQNPSL